MSERRCEARGRDCKLYDDISRSAARLERRHRAGRARDGTVARVIVLQYNPDTLTRTIQPRSTAAEASDRLEALRLTGPPVETFKLDAELDATDQLEFPDQNPNVVEFGLQPQLAALETLVYPSSGVLQVNNRLARAGTLEIAPAESLLTIFVWSKNRILPVRLTISA